MIEDITEEIIKCLDNNCFIAALSLALALPDICGKAEYPKLKTTKRYIKWYDEFITLTDEANKMDWELGPQPKLDGAVANSFRNSLTHEGNTTIDLKKADMNEFIVFFEKSNEFDLYVSKSSVVKYNFPIDSDLNNKTIKTYRVNVQSFCRDICRAVNVYYQENQEKFSFLKNNIVFHADEKQKIDEISRLNRR